MPRKPLAERIAVTIYQFRGGAGAIDASAATDMFTTALIKSGQFRVVERAQLNAGLIFEKQLNGAAQSTGDVAKQQLRGAQYIFEGTVSQATAGADQHQSGINFGGLDLGQQKQEQNWRGCSNYRCRQWRCVGLGGRQQIADRYKFLRRGRGGTCGFSGSLRRQRRQSADPRRQCSECTHRQY